uniref:Uncharacterized protein n=1 Tax=Arundo donax TaxID=35708 RepID=A0A0A9AW15_ARUDO
MQPSGPHRPLDAHLRQSCLRAQCLQSNASSAWPRVNRLAWPAYLQSACSSPTCSTPASDPPTNPLWLAFCSMPTKISTHDRSCRYRHALLRVLRALDTHAAHRRLASPTI